MPGFPLDMSDAAVDGSTKWTAKAVNDIRNIIVGPTMYNVKSTQYGAKGDGAADDSLAIQAALDDCRVAGGGMVFIPPGTYMTSVAIRYGAGGAGAWAAFLIGGDTLLRGAGREATIVKLLPNQPTGSHIVNWGHNVGGDEQIAIEDFSCDGNAPNQTAVISGTEMWNARNTHLARMRWRDFRGVQNSTGNESWNTRIVSGADATYIDCESIGIAGGSTNGFVTASTTGVKYVNCISYGIAGTTSGGFGFNASTGSKDISYEGCKAYLCGSGGSGEGFHTESSPAAIMSLRYVNCVAGGTSRPGAGYPFSDAQNLGNVTYGFNFNSGCNGITMTGCEAEKNGSWGMSFTTNDSVQIFGPTLRANVTGGMTFSGNTRAALHGGVFDGTVIGINCNTVTDAANLRITGGPTWGPTANSTANYRVAGVNYPGFGAFTSPAIPATTVWLQNPFSFDCQVKTLGGTVTDISIATSNAGANLQQVAVASPALFRIPAGAWVKLIYSVVPTSWSWWAD